ncbi:hypothetical protein [Pseudomonas sp. MYb118]|uniref:hypothetical protein n=1 Tax=Pseudomonas sp. MYb118 TaxID=1848720 RepID=UPI0034CFECE3
MDGPAEYDSSQFKVTYEDFTRFVEGVNVTNVCGSCGADNEWYVHTSNFEQSEADACELTIYRLDHASLQAFRAAFMEGCEKCGTIRTYDATVVTEWLKVNPKKVSWWK